MKLTSNAGHSKYAGGAKYGTRKEHNIALQINKIFIEEAKKRGVECVDSTSEAISASLVLSGQVKKANASKANIGVSHHLNAGGGTGIEVWYDAGSAAGKTIATKVSSVLAQHYNLKNRGAKPDTQDRYKSLYWLSNTKMPAILIEWGFIDSDKDMKVILGDIRGGVNAVLTALGVKPLPITPKPPVKNTKPPVNTPAPKFKSYKTKVIKNSVIIRTGPGVNYKDTGARVRKNEVYTIIAESLGRGAKKWGKLKSGKGWISLDFTKKL